MLTVPVSTLAVEPLAAQSVLMLQVLPLQIIFEETSRHCVLIVSQSTFPTVLIDHEGPASYPE